MSKGNQKYYILIYNIIHYYSQFAFHIQGQNHVVTFSCGFRIRHVTTNWSVYWWLMAHSVSSDNSQGSQALQQQR